MGNFHDLKVWQISKSLAVEIYKLTNNTKSLKSDYGLKDQLRRSAVSIPSNIAEGDELDTNKQAIKHFYIAKGSTAELRTQLIIAQEAEIISTKEASELINETKIISTMLLNLIKHRKQF